MRVYVGSGSDSGRVRKSNQDAVGVDLANGFFIVADGVGGNAGGDVASGIIVSLTKEFVASARPAYEDRKNALVSGIREANSRVFQIALSENKRGMSSTVTAFLIGFGKYFVAQVGDSRAYLIRGNDMFQITKDHSFVQQLVDRGVITPDEARSHDRRNEITRSVGIDAELEIDTYEGEFRETDALLACSDGLWEEVTDKEMLDTILSSEDGQQACNALIEQANAKGGHDNISVILAQSSPTRSGVSPRKRAHGTRRLMRQAPAKRAVLIGAGAVVLVALSVLVTLLLAKRPPPEELVRFVTKPDTLQATLARTGETLQIVTGNSYSLRVPATLTFRRTGYLDTTLVIAAPTGEKYKVELKPILVQVTFNLPPGAEVSFSDGRKARSTESLPPGSHSLLCTRPGYQPCETTLQITGTSPVVFDPVFESRREEPAPESGPKERSELSASLSKTVTVRFVSKDRSGRMYGAEILINGESTGKHVPDRLELERRQHYAVALRCSDGTSSVSRDLREIRESSRTDFTYTDSDFRFR